MYKRQENGIVAESTAAARLRGDHAFDGIGKNRKRTALLRERQHANESRAPFVAALFAHFLEQLSHAIRVGSIRARIPRGMNSRRSSERRNHQPGIIGDQKLIRELRIMNRFTGGIFGKCGRGFLERGQLRDCLLYTSRCV